MSFFSKINKEFEGLFNDDKKKDTNQGEMQRGYDQGGYGYASQPQYGSHPQSGAPQYGAPPPGPQYTSPPPASHYSAPPPGSQYGVPPPASHYGATVPPTPSLPVGWIALWEPNGQRWAYLDANSKVIWTVPTYPSYPDPNVGGEGSRGYGDGQGGYGQGQHGYDGDYQQREEYKDKGKDGKGKMIMGAAAGVAVGAIGGALLANALDDDDEHHGGGGYGQGEHYPPMGGPLPDETASGSSVSSSDKEDVEEARQEYEEAYEEAYGSD